MKYTYKIIGLDCANCAKKIEDYLNKDERFQDVVLNFSTSKLTYETNISNSFEVVNEIIDELEPGAKLIKTKEKTKKEYSVSLVIIALLFFCLGNYLDFKFNYILVIISYLILLYKPFKKALLMLIKSHTINENLLIVISCIGAYLIGSKMEGVMVVTLYLIGKILEEKAVNRTRRSIEDLVLIKQDYANLRENDKLKKISVETVLIGDILGVKKGEKVPVDGIVVEGSSNVNTSSITGESELLKVKKNDLVYSGYINTGDLIYIKATKKYENSMVFKILELVENASNRKASVETNVSRLSRVYTPIILVLAILTYIFLPIIGKVSYEESLYRALTFLVISCPCAIAISVPLSYFTGLGVSSKKGILIKGSNYLDNLSKLNKIIFDKTGTLTTGELTVSSLKILDNEYDENELINIIVSGELLSNHPIASSIIKLKKTKEKALKVSDFKEIEGMGITYRIDDMKVMIGNSKLCNCKIDTDIHVNINNKHVASLILTDEIKENTKDAIDYLKENKVETFMFTGDKKEKALKLGNSLNLDKVYYEMLPTDKFSMYEKVSKDNEIVAYVGDGVNDAPVLKRATIGISMGALGSDAAISVSDIVIMNDNLKSIEEGIKISKYTNFIIKENLIGALSVKILILISSIFGYASMWLAVLADTGLTVLCILNTLRIIVKFKKEK